MNILHMIFGNRRKDDAPVVDDRRKSAAKRLQAASERVNRAAEELTETLSMTRSDFNALLDKDRKRVEAVHGVVQFSTFAEICEYRYSPKESLMRLCKHEDHEAHSTGVAACNAKQCPRLK